MIDPRDFAEDAFHRLSDRGLGSLVIESDLHAMDTGDALFEAADNLLDKAHDALGAGDSARAERFIARALQLPFNDHEEASPALWSSHLSLLSLVSMLVEESPEGDSSWLDGALAVLDAGPDGVRGAMVPVLATVLAEQQLSPAESRRLRAALHRHPGFATDADLDGRALSEAARAALVRNSILAEIQLSEALDDPDQTATASDPDDAGDVPGTHPD